MIEVSIPQRVRYAHRIRLSIQSPSREVRARYGGVPPAALLLETPLRVSLLSQLRQCRAVTAESQQFTYTTPQLFGRDASRDETMSSFVDDYVEASRCAKNLLNCSISNSYNSRFSVRRSTFSRRQTSERADSFAFPRQYHASSINGVSCLS